MLTKRMLALALAGVMAAGLLCGCPWHDAPSSSSGSSTSTRRPTGSGSDDDSDDDDDDTPVVEATTYTEVDENGNTITITEGDGFTRTETEATKEVSYTVTNAAGLVKWGTEVNASRETTNGEIDCTLENDINMAGVNWTPVGTGSGFYDVAFCGIFDGGGHRISNLNVTATSSGGLFAFTRFCCIKNLTLDNATISGRINAGGIAGAATLGVTIMGCTVTNSTITAIDGDAGGIAGQIEHDSKVIGCMVSNSTIEWVGVSTHHAGGIVGSTSYSAGSGNIIACCSVDNEGIATADTIGFCGIAGDISLSSSDSKFIFQSCYWSGSANNVADIRHPTSTGYVEYQDQYDGAEKITDNNWGEAIEKMNGALSGTACEYRYSGNPPQLGPANGASLLANHFGLSLPF